MTSSRRQAIAYGASALAGALAPGGARAQKASYPTRPVRIVVGYAPGGAADIASRMLAEWLSAHLGQPFIVENKPGASGTLAANQVAKSANDGHTLFYGPGFGMTMGSGASRVEYKPDQQFDPVHLMVELPLVLVVNAGLPVKNLQELIAFAKSRDGALNYASYGKGTTSHLASEALINQARLRVEHILYKGSAPAVLALRSGEVQLMFDTVASAAPHVKAGALRALAVTSEKRMGLLPQTPTMQEAGMPGVRMSGWMGLFAPKGTPAPVVARLNAEVQAVLAQPALKDRIAKLGGSVVPEDAVAFGNTIQKDYVAATKLVRDAKIKAE